jgi:hypothetical protein
MIDRTAGQKFVVVARVGRVDLGETTVTVDEDSLHLVAADASDPFGCSLRRWTR